MTGAELHITLLGRFAVTRAGEAVNVGGPKQQALLAYLAFHAGQAVDREDLISLLWGDRFDEQARQSLRQALARLRRALRVADAEPIETDGDAVTLNGRGVAIDLLEFRDLSNHSNGESLSEAADYQGQLLRGMNIRQDGFDAWLARERSALDQQFGAVFSRLSAQLAEQKHWPEAVDAAERWAAIDPLNEAAARQVMRCRMGNGDRAGALQHYQALRDLLLAELDTEPAAETADLATEIRTGSNSTPTPAATTPHRDTRPRAVTRMADVDLPELDGVTLAILPFRCLDDVPDHQDCARGLGSLIAQTC